MNIALIIIIISLICCSSSPYNDTSTNDTIISLDLIDTPETIRMKAFDAMKMVWLDKLEETRISDKETKRSQKVLDILKYGSGIYTNNTKAEALKLTNTVFITLYNNENGDKRYIHLLKNQLCYCAQYGLKPLIYVLNTHDNSTLQSLTNDFQKINPSSQTISYPLHLFYKFLVRKRTIIEARPGLSDYLYEVPSFKHFGAVTMIIPMLEVIQNNYDFIFFDVDIVFIVDPIPYMTRSIADIVVSQETRSCKQYTSLTVESYDWAHAEPNTGVIFVRSNSKTINLYHGWISNLVTEQPANDQFFLVFRKFNAKFKKDCLIGPFNDSAFTYKFEADFDLVVSPLSYCFFEEFLFQNGLIGCHCQNGFRKSNVNMWPMMMSRYAMSSTTSLPSLRDQQKKLQPIPNRIFFHPVIMHMNYVGDKVKCSRDRGSFIYDIDKNMCYNFNLEESHWAKMDWRSVIWDATENLNYSDVSWLNSFLSKSVEKLTFLNKTTDTISLTQGYSKIEIDMIADYIVNNRNIVPFTF